jgi:hypothetical protein
MLMEGTARMTITKLLIRQRITLFLPPHSTNKLLD